jgi:ubiquinone biosynthesis protein
MSFIEGTKILGVGHTRSDPKRIARLGMHALMKMIFEDGFVHADLHPGNIFITTDDRVALLDLGLVGEIDPFHRAALARFFAAWAQQDGEGMAKQIYSLSTSHADDRKTYEAFRTSVINFVARYWGQRLADVQVGKVLIDMLGILRRHRIRMTPVFTIVNIAIAVTEGIGKQLDPDLDLMAEAIPFFIAHPSLTAPAAEG